MKRTNKILYITLLVNGVFFLALGILFSTNTLTLPRGDISPIVFYIVGGLLLAFGGCAWIAEVVEKTRLEQCKANGKRINAVIVRFTCNRTLRVLGRHPANLTCKDSAGNIYKAKFLYEYGTSFREGDTVFVYADMANPKKYAIDLQEYSSR